ncbi:MAG: BBP7 family outer membrane beta-barrel protein [Bythopirellula sp.]
MRSQRFLMVSSSLALMLILVQAVALPELQAQTSFPPPLSLAPGGSAPASAMQFSNEIATRPADEAAASSNPMLWQQYQALQTGGPLEESGQDCSACGAGGYNRCGCNTGVFPWFSGPGDCDQFCIGPKWAVDIGGLMMFRDDADWNRVIAAVGDPTTLVDQFEHGPGGRLFFTGYNEYGYGIQIGYEGINDWDANLHFANAGGFTREITYQTRLNSVEINFLPLTQSPWKWFSGFRYVQYDEDYIDFNRADRVLPAPATPAATAQTIDNGLNRLLENRLFGFQVGSRRDAWQLGNRITLQTFANAGVYCNKFRREDVEATVTTTISGDDTATPEVTELTESSSSFNTTTRDDIAEIAFVGEAGFSAAYRFNHCCAVRGGYQVLALDGVGNALAASFVPGLPDNGTLVFHGLQFGLEYRR